MHGESRYKVPGGKLVEVRLEYDESIGKIEILGDFFIYPEEALALIERAILGARRDASEREIEERIEGVLRPGGIEMIGVTAEAIAKAVRLAVKA